MRLLEFFYITKDRQDSWLALTEDTRLSKIDESYLAEQTKCGIMNALMKYRPDLESEYNKVSPGKVNQSILFLQDMGLWDDHAQDLAKGMQKLRSAGDREQSIKYVRELMCHVAKIIKNSSPETNTPYRTDAPRPVIEEDRRGWTYELQGIEWSGEYDDAARERLKRERGKRWWTESRLDEVPVQDIQIFGMDKPLDVPSPDPKWKPKDIKPSMPAQDIKMLANPKYWNVVRKKFERAPFTYNLYFANLNLPKLVKWDDYKQESSFTEEFIDLLSKLSGMFPAEEIQEEFGIPIKSVPGTISVLFLSNADASKVAMRMTPWIMAHRLGHSVEDELKEKDNYIRDHFMIHQRKYAAQRYKNKHKEYVIPYDELLTMKSARERKLRRFESIPELIAQFILAGKVTLARPIEPGDDDQILQFTNGYKFKFNADQYRMIKNNVEEVENKTNEILQEYFEFWEEHGVIFVAP